MIDLIQIHDVLQLARAYLNITDEARESVSLLITAIIEDRVAIVPSKE